MGPQAQRASRAFAQELSTIKDQAIRAFVFDVFDKVCPDYFWDRPASKAGYHPAFVCGPAGLVRHVKYACWWGTQMCRAMSGNGTGDDVGPYHDVVIAALIIHDMVKDGDEGRTRPKTTIRMTNYHGVELMEAIIDRVFAGRTPTKEELLIIQGVAAHMGVWTKPEEFRPWNLKGSEARKVATLVHLADYAASRKVDEIIPALANFMPG
jgi:hypothetical protein